MRIIQLIELYLYVCQMYEEDLKWHCLRMTKNGATPEFTDEEVLTVYLFGLAYERKFRVKDCYDYIANHWLDCFPELPSYHAFNNRLNRLAGIMPRVVETLVQKYRTDNSEQAIDWVLTDSMPIITCSGKRRGKVATELCNMGYNSTKNLHFFGVKLHGVEYYRRGTLPLLEYLYLTPASMHDLKAQRDIRKRPSNHILRACPMRLIFAATKAKTHAIFTRNNSSISGSASLKRSNSDSLLRRPWTQSADLLLLEEKI